MNEALAVEEQVQTEPVEISKIHKRPGHNPRRMRSTKRMDELRESIRDQGVIQAILVRPHPQIEGDYELVAGETRLDLSVEVGLTHIPALIRRIDDDDMGQLALVENVQRTNMTPMDEGSAAKKLLIEHKNDKQEVCRVLGWSQKKLDGRIQLTRCIDPVAQALCDEQISVGHAQYLSGLRAESQEKGLAMVIENKLSVDELRERIEALSLKLVNAIFDKTECQTCPHNSSLQSSLFDNGVEDGRCLNKACFQAKTDAHLSAVKEDLAENYHRVELDRDVAEGATTVLASSGPHGVGSDQIAACQQCEHNGAIINTQIGNEGHVQRNVCFNLPCNKTKIEAYQQIIATDAAPAKATGGSGSSTTPAAGSATASQPTSTKAKAKAKASAGADALPKKILARHHEVHRAGASEIVASDQRLAKALAVISLLKDTGVGMPDKPEGWPASFSQFGRQQAIRILDGYSEAELDALIQRIASTSMVASKDSFTQESWKDPFGMAAVAIATDHKAGLAPHFTMDRDYLEAHTKPVITRLLTESGFKSDYEAKHGEKAFKTLVGAKKGEILETVEKSGFDFNGFVPESLSLTPKASSDTTTEQGETA